MLVTGGAQGIGKGIAFHLLKEGHKVVIVDVDEEAGRETADSFEAIGEVHFVKADTGDDASVREAVRQAITHFGHLDGLVNNAGIADPGNTPIEDLSIEAWERVIRTNLTGYYLCTRYCVPHLRERGGAIVHIASTRALQSEPHTEAYAASKGGIVALTHALAVSLGPAIRVNCISPGWIVVSDWKKAADRKEPDLRPIDHEQHPAGRAGIPEDIASVAAFLLSSRAGFITGQNFVVDGGMTRKMIYAD